MATIGHTIIVPQMFQLYSKLQNWHLISINATPQSYCLNCSNFWIFWFLWWPCLTHLLLFFFFQCQCGWYFNLLRAHISNFRRKQTESHGLARKIWRWTYYLSSGLIVYWKTETNNIKTNLVSEMQKPMMTLSFLSIPLEPPLYKCDFCLAVRCGAFHRLSCITNAHSK